MSEAALKRRLSVDLLLAWFGGAAVLAGIVVLSIAAGERSAPLSVMAAVPIWGVIAVGLAFSLRRRRSPWLETVGWSWLTVALAAFAYLRWTHA